MMKMPARFKLAILAAPALVSALSGCSSARLQERIDNDVASIPVNHVLNTLPHEGIKGSAEDIKARNVKFKDMPVLRASTSPWIGGTFSAATKEDGLPGLFNENYTLEFGEGKVSLSVLASRLTKMTRVPVRIRADVYGAASAKAATPAAVKPGTPVSADGAVIASSAISSMDTVSVDGVSMRWNGKLRDFLDNLTNTLNLSWEYRDGAVVILRNLTENYTIAGMVGAQTFDMSTGSSASGSAGSTGATSSMTANGNFTEKGQLDAFGSILNTVKSMVGTAQGANVIANTQTGSIVVIASKDVQAQVRDYIAEQNKILGRNVNVTMDIYTITDTDKDTQGVNWNLVYQSLSQKYGLNIVSPATLVGSTAAAVTITGLSGDAAGTQAIFNTLKETGKSVTLKPISMTTMNGKLKVQSDTSSTAYVKETTPGVAGASGAAGAPGLKTDTVTVGDVYAVLPIVQPDSSVLLKYSVRMSNLLSIANFTSGVGASAQSVNLPQTTSVGDGTDIHLQPGEAVMITGLSRSTSSSSNNRVADGAPMALGGSTVNSVTRENFVVVLRATPM